MKNVNAKKIATGLKQSLATIKATLNLYLIKHMMELLFVIAILQLTTPIIGKGEIVNIEINAEKLAQLINEDLVDMRWSETSAFAIAEHNGIQVQILLTKDSSDFCDPVMSGIASIK